MYNSHWMDGPNTACSPNTRWTIGPVVTTSPSTVGRFIRPGVTTWINANDISRWDEKVGRQAGHAESHLIDDPLLLKSCFVMTHCNLAEPKQGSCCCVWFWPCVWLLLPQSRTLMTTSSLFPCHTNSAHYRASKCMLHKCIVG